MDDFMVMLGLPFVRFYQWLLGEHRRADAVPYGIERADHTFECVEATSMQIDDAGRLWLYTGRKEVVVLKPEEWLYAERNLDEQGVRERSG